MGEGDGRGRRRELFQIGCDHRGALKTVIVGELGSKVIGDDEENILLFKSTFRWVKKDADESQADDKAMRR